MSTAHPNVMYFVVDLGRGIAHRVQRTAFTEEAFLSEIHCEEPQKNPLASPYRTCSVSFLRF